MAKYEIKDGVGIVPEGTTKIESDFFEEKDKLESVIIPDSVTEIGGDAFAGCTNLKNVTIPGSVTTFGDGVFWCCESLTEIIIPASVNKIGHSLFGGCTNLKSIVVEGGNKTFDSRNNCNAIVETATNRLIACCSNTTIPSSITEIGFTAFRNCVNLKDIRIPNSVTTIGANAFANCNSLASLTIPDSVTKIDDSAFSECEKLESISLSNTIKKVGDYLFYKCSNLTNIIIPNSVTEIGEAAFFLCQQLESITIPDSVVKIGPQAFAGCFKLKAITFVGLINDMGEKVFKSCKALAAIQVPKGKEEDYKRLLPEEVHGFISSKEPTKVQTVDASENLDEKIESIKQLMKERNLKKVSFYTMDNPQFDKDGEPLDIEYGWERCDLRFWMTEDYYGNTFYDAAVTSITLKKDSLLFDVSIGEYDCDGIFEETETDTAVEWATIKEKCEKLQRKDCEEWLHQLLDNIINEINDQ